jgi:hypothetical protein
MIRKLLAVGALAGLFLVSGCNESDDSGGDAASGGGTPTATATSAPPTAADNTKKVCADMAALRTELEQRLAPILQRAIQEGLAGDEAKAEKTLEEAKALAVEIAGKVQALSASASNPELKQALADMSVEIKNSDVESADTAVSAAEAKYKQICGA